MSSIIEKAMDWLRTGTTNEVFIKKGLVALITILAVYRLGYAVGKCIFHIVHSAR